MRIERKSEIVQRALRGDSVSFDLDLRQLDHVIERQATDIYEASMALAEAKYEVDKAKREVDLIRADLDAQIRSNPAKFGIAKLTEAAVASVIEKDETYQAAMEALLQARLLQGRIAALVSALQDRRKLLEAFASLCAVGYFGDVRVDPSTVRKPLNSRKEVV